MVIKVVYMNTKEKRKFEAVDTTIEDLKKIVYDGWEVDNESYYFFKDGKLILKIPVLLPFFYFLKDFNMIIRESSED